jgi:hypothetical protein
VVREAAGVIAQTIVGAAFMGGGGYVAWNALQHEPHDKTVLYSGLAAAVFGALIFPSIFPIAQKIVILCFLGGLPLIGGRRSDDDPPAPPPAP